VHKYLLIAEWECDPSKRSAWHPSEQSGPFKELLRGEFLTKTAALEWWHLTGGKYGSTAYRLEIKPMPHAEYIWTSACEITYALTRRGRIGSYDAELLERAMSAFGNVELAHAEDQS